MNRSESIKELAKSLSGFQGELYNATKDTKAHNYNYADLGQVLSIVRPLLSKHALSFIQCAEKRDESNVVVETTLMHESGEWVCSELVMPIAKGSNISHAVGSAISYARRYSLTAMLGIAQQDDDSNGGAAFVQPKPVTPILSKEMSDAIHCLKEHYEDNDRLTSIDFFESFTESEKKVIWNHSESQVKVWLKNVMDNRPKGQ